MDLIVSETKKKKKKERKKTRSRYFATLILVTLQPDLRLGEKKGTFLVFVGF
jgi:hypothetical protein